MREYDFLARWKQFIFEAFMDRDRIPDTSSATLSLIEVTDNADNNKFSIKVGDLIFEPKGLLAYADILLNYFYKKISRYQSTQLTPDDLDFERDTEWTLLPEESVWITAGKNGEASIRIYQSNEALVISVSRTGAEDEDIDLISTPWDYFVKSTDTDETQEGKTQNE